MGTAWLESFVFRYLADTRSNRSLICLRLLSTQNQFFPSAACLIDLIVDAAKAEMFHVINASTAS